MPTAFVTGATGFLGRHLLDALSTDGWRITALHRSAAPPQSWAALPVDPVRGDIVEPESLSGAIPGGVDAVFHAAADTSPWRGHMARQSRVNVDGTAAMLEAARIAGAKRFVHVSSISVFGHHDAVVTEQTEQRGLNSWVGYVRTKAKAEELVRQAVAEEGLDACICNPTHIMGPFDDSNWASLFLLIDKDKLPGVPPGGGCFANAKDVARGLVAAARKGRCGENYILGGPHASFLKVTRQIARLLGKPEPRRVAPALLLKAAGLLGDLRGLITRREPAITPETVHFVCHDERASSAKAKSELGYEETPLAETLSECHRWLWQEGLVGGRLRRP